MLEEALIFEIGDCETTGVDIAAPEGSMVVAPADGEICLIEMAPPPVELGLSDEPRLRVSIFLSILDAHVQRAPIGGQVVAAVHQHGEEAGDGRRARAVRADRAGAGAFQKLRQFGEDPQ